MHKKRDEEHVDSLEQEQKERKEDDVTWRKEEKAYLKSLISIHGTHDWTTVASSMMARFPQRERSGTECANCWDDYLDPSMTKRPWTDEDEAELLMAHYKYQNKWADVAGCLEGRSNNTTKNKFYCVFRKVKNKIKRHELTYESKLDILEIRYVIFLMERYFEKMPPGSEHKYRRGKDFVLTLMRNLKRDEVHRFKQRMQEIIGPEWGPEDLETVFAHFFASSAPPVPRVPTSPPNRHSRIGSPVAPLPLPFESEAHSLNIPGPAQHIPLANMVNLLPTPVPAPKSTSITAQTALPQSNFTLPPPHPVLNAEPLTLDEKDFVMAQAFRPKQSLSAGVHYSQSVGLNSAGYAMAPLSTGLPSIPSMLSLRPAYEGFSDLSDVAAGQMREHEHQVRLQTQSQHIRRSSYMPEYGAVSYAVLPQPYYFQPPH